MDTLSTKRCEFVHQVTTVTPIVLSCRSRCVIVRRYSSVPSRTISILAHPVGITLNRSPSQCYKWGDVHTVRISETYCCTALIVLYIGASCLRHLSLTDTFFLNGFIFQHAPLHFM
jgi:hypothetical protein